MKVGYKILTRYDLANRISNEASGRNVAARNRIERESMESNLKVLGSFGWRLVLIEKVDSYNGDDDRFYFEEIKEEGGAE